MRKVLLATDGSVAAEEAARMLSHFPHPETLDLLVLSVVNPPHVHGSEAMNELVEQRYEADKERAGIAFRQIVTMFEGANCELRHEIRSGNVAQAIVAAATDMQADLVVLGAKGRSQISRVLLGSVSDYVATHAPCSVLVVRDTGIREMSRPIRVCLAYESEKPAEAAAMELSELPWRSGTEFHLLAVASIFYDYLGEVHEDTEAAERLRNDLLEVKKQLEEVAPHARVHLEKGDHIGEAIVNFADEYEIDLMIVGETPRGSLNRILMGSTSRYVLRHAPSSVWIARTHLHRLDANANDTGATESSAEKSSQSERHSAP